MDVTELLDLPLDEAAKVVAHIRPRDADELYWWVKNFTGYVLPRKKVCENHVAPLMAIWKIFEEEILDAILFANRSGGKTVGMAVLNLLDMEFKQGCEIATVGAILPQARKGYKYLTQMLQSPLFSDDVVETLMRETSLGNGSSVEIVSSTTSGLNSPHPNKARADEVELMDWDSVQQFFSMAVSSPGIRAQQVLSSTRKTLTGSMQKLLDRCEKDPSFTFQVLAWCLSGDSLIDTPSGERKLRDMKPGDWVYSYDLNAGRLTVKRVKHVGITGVKKKVKRVVLRYGKNPARTRELIATPDHKVLLANEVWAQVQDLRPGTRLMAINRWHDRMGYGMLCFPARQVAKLTVDGFPMQPGIASRLKRENRFVWEAVNGTIPAGFVIHHVDGEIWNNDPPNLNAAPRTEHSRGHTGEFWENGKYVNAAEKRTSFYAENPEKLSERNRKVNLNRKDRNHPVVANHVVVSVEDAGEMDVWNMEVEDTHTFIAEGIVVKNCIWETVQTCEMPDCEECKKVIRSDNESFFEHCAGKAREADGFYAIEDAWRKFKLLDPDVWDAEWEGKKPSTGGLVVGKQWDDAVHWLPWVVYDPRLISLGGVDFGYDAPFAAGVGQINQNRDLTMIDEYYGSELTLTTHIIPKLLQMQEEYRVLVWFCDATAPMQIMDLRHAGVRAVPCSRDRKASYNNVRAYLTGHITNKPRFAMSQKMENFKRDFMTCHFMKGQQDAVHNEHSHGLDAVAYLIWGILYKLDKILGSEGGKGGGELPTSGGDGRGTHGRRHRA